MRTGCQSESGLSTADFNQSLIRRFQSKVGIADSAGCIAWLGCKTSKGYGVLRIAGRGAVRTVAHRIAWVLRHGDIAPKILVLHRCDNPACVNPEHLFLGTALENTQDMVSKGRQSWRNRTPWQKLHAADVAKIRELRASGHTQQFVADQIGISRPMISMIERGKIKHAVSANCAERR